MVAKFAVSFRAASNDEGRVAGFADFGSDPVAQDQATPEANHRKLESEIAKWRPPIHAAGV